MTNSKPVNNQKADRGKNKKAGNVKPTAEEKRDSLAKQLRLKPKTKAFIDLMNDNPKLSATEAYIQTHETTNRVAAGNNASRVLKKANVIGYKDAAVNKAKRRIVSLVDSDNENTALKASQDIIDRNEGKAIQKNESISRTVEVKVDLTGVKIGSHYLHSSQVDAILEG